MRWAALTAQSASSAIRHSVIATASSAVTTRTRAPRLGTRSTRPSAVRSSSAARSDCLVTPSALARSSSTSRRPGARSPLRIACRIAAKACARAASPACGPPGVAAGMPRTLRRSHTDCQQSAMVIVDNLWGDKSGVCARAARGSMAAMAWQTTGDVTEFLAAAGPYLRRERVAEHRYPQRNRDDAGERGGVAGGAAASAENRPRRPGGRQVAGGAARRPARRRGRCSAGGRTRRARWRGRSCTRRPSRSCSPRSPLRPPPSSRR